MAKLRVAEHTSLYLLCCRLRSGTGSLSERSWSVRSSHPSTSAVTLSCRMTVHMV